MRIETNETQAAIFITDWFAPNCHIFTCPFEISLTKKKLHLSQGFSKQLRCTATSCEMDLMLDILVGLQKYPHHPKLSKNSFCVHWDCADYKLPTGSPTTFSMNKNRIPMIYLIITKLTNDYSSVRKLFHREAI